MTDKIKAEDFIKAFGSGGIKEPEHHIITDNIMEDYESRGCELWTCDFKKVGGSS